MESFLTFLAGESGEQIQKVVECLLKHEAIPAFVDPSLHDGLELARTFYRIGPEIAAGFRRTHGLRIRIVTYRKMDTQIQAGVRTS